MFYLGFLSLPEMTTPFPEVDRSELLSDVAACEGPKLQGTKAAMPLRLYEKPGQGHIESFLEQRL